MSFLESVPSLKEKVKVELDESFGPMLASSEDVPTLQMLIDGEWRPARAGDLFDVFSPIDGGVIARAQKSSKEDLEAAISTAREARRSFASLPASERLSICEQAAELMEEHLDNFVDVIVRDLGKTPDQARSEVTATQERLGLAREEVRKIFGEYLPGDWIGDTTGKSGIVLREPIGTVAAIGPFNYPLFLSASKIIPALAAGNTVVAKAPSDAPIALLMFARILEQAGLPAGALNIVTGRGSEIGDVFATSADIGMISFTGSTSIGRRLAELAGPKPLHLELGGNAAAIVLADADLDLAVEKCAGGAFKNGGQRCDAISRVLVERPIYDDYVERAVKEAESWVVGDPRAEGVKVGPLVSGKAADSVKDLVADAVDKGARLLLGGEKQDAYFQPTVLADIPLDADIVWEETFGPVLALVEASDLENALEIANRSKYGLDSAVFSSSLDKAWKAARELECGMVTVNDAPQHGVGHFPFGGRKPDSGIGREGLGYSIDECTSLKTVVLPS